MQRWCARRAPSGNSAVVCLFYYGNNDFYVSYQKYYPGVVYEEPCIKIELSQITTPNKYKNNINLFEFGLSFNKLCYENINILQKNDCAIHLTR